jgi:hypothetical protein
MRRRRAHSAVATIVALKNPLWSRDDRGGANDDYQCTEHSDVQCEMFGAHFD